MLIIGETMAEIISVTKHNFEQEITNAKKPVIIDAFATWCGPCQHMEPIFEELADEYGDKYTFAKLNIDEARDIAVKFGIMSVPTFLFLKEGKVVGQEVGYKAKEDLLDHLKQYLG